MECLEPTDGGLHACLPLGGRGPTRGRGLLMCRPVAWQYFFHFTSVSACFLLPDTLLPGYDAFRPLFQCTCHSRHLHKRPDRRSQAPVTASDALPFQEASAPGRGGLSDESDEAFALVHFRLSVLGVISCHSLADPSLFLVSGCSGALFAFLGLPILPSLFWGFFQRKSLYPCTVYGRAGLAADSLCCGVQSKSLLPPSP